MSVAEKTAPEQAAEPDVQRSAPVTTIGPPTRLPKLDVRELWQYRELAGVLAWRDVKVKYKQTLVGVVWVLIQPLLAAGIFTVFFGRYANLYSDGLPYPLFVFAGTLMWYAYFQPAFAGTSGSISMNRALVTKVYFPRLLLPLGTVVTPLVDFAVVFPILIGATFWYDIPLSAQLFFFPLFVLLAAVTAFAAGLLLTVAAVRYRDVPYAIPFLVQIWMFASPVFWSINDPDLQEKYQWLASLNPMTGAISGLRWSVLGADRPDAPVMALGTVVAVSLLIGALAMFRRAEPRFADTI